MGFLQSYHNSHINIRRILKSAHFTFLRFAVLNPCLSVSFFHPLLFVILFFFCTTCEMPTGPV